MYEDFYKFLGRPFSPAADPSCYFLSLQHAEALAVAQYSLLTNAGLTVITGESGLGKTLLMRRVSSNLDDSIVLGTIEHTHTDFRNILPWVISAFELRSRMSDPVEMHEVLIQFLKEQAQSDRRVVLVIDEAQNLSQSALEEVRLLMNLSSNDKHGLQFVLLGQPRFREMLKQASMSELAQRVAIDFELYPFDYESTDDYITYRLSIQGGLPELFPYTTRASIYYHSKGIPRLINSICDLALVYGFGESSEIIDLKIIKRVIQSQKVSLGIYERLELTPDASGLRTAIHASHGVDIGNFGML